MILSILPSLLSWQQISPLLIRLTLGLVLLVESYRSVRRDSKKPATKALHLVEGLAGLLIVIGLWTQLSALFVAVDLVFRLIGKIKRKAFLTDGVNYYLLLLVMALSLLVTGAGAFWAFDMPL